MRRIALGVVLALVAILSIGSLALAADTGPISEPTIDTLATAAGIAGVVFIVMQVLRSVVPEAAFDRYGALLAVVVGILLALAYALVQGNATGATLLQAVLVGLFGGALSQNVNTIAVRAIKGP